jgi:membrane-associated protein
MHELRVAKALGADRGVDPLDPQRAEVALLHLAVAVSVLPGLLDRARLGRRLRASAERTYARLETVSTAALAMGRFIPFGRTASAATAGLVGVPPRRYVRISALGATAWAAWLLGLGYFTGQAISGPSWVQALIATGVGVVAAVAIAALQRLLERRRANSRERTPAPQLLS